MTTPRRLALLLSALLLSPLPEANATTTPVDPYPQPAAGWGPSLGDGHMASRWAEPLPGDSALALRAELRLRQAAWHDAPGRAAGTTDQGQLRAQFGADWRPLPALRVYGELAVGDVDGGRDAAPANFRNALSVQQLFVELRRPVGNTLAGVMAGRQGFADGPRQLLSLSDGPNLHRSWNGLRAYVHGRRWRLGAFDLRATRLGTGAFDDVVDPRETLRGLNAGFVLGERSATYLEPFWFRSTQPAYRVAGQPGRDARNTTGLRVWGSRAAWKFDATLARQAGTTVGNRAIDAWGLFAVGGLALSDAGWKPRLTARLDLASGGGAWGSGTVRSFHPLYASSSYVSEGQLLALSNVAILASGVSLSPTPRTTFSGEIGHVRRMSAEDALYATATRAYAGTQHAPGRHVGELLRLQGSWRPDPRLTLRLTVEHLHAGAVLRRAGHGSSSFAFLDLTWRY
ncbi:alginate export family protein [Arenimonas sp.]|uniref:alginate export family protein n=1 Tax=Arenimonas sp. TaxID=1872635 RepID=UPI0035ADBB0A